MHVTADQFRTARNRLRLSIADVSRDAGITPRTLNRLEAGLGSQTLTARSVKRTLERAGAIFGPAGQVEVAAEFPLVELLRGVDARPWATSKDAKLSQAS